MITDEQCVQAYRKHEQLFAAADEIGMPWQTLYVRLKAMNVAVCGNKSRWGSVKDKFAAKAENMFLSLVPFAKDQNREQFQSKVDFIVNGMKVDVKASKPRQSSKHFKSKRWAFSLKKQIESADFYVLFCFADDGETLQESYLIPRDIIGDIYTVSIPVTSNSKWKSFLIKPNDLAEFFSSLSN